MYRGIHSWLKNMLCWLKNMHSWLKNMGSESFLGFFQSLIVAQFVIKSFDFRYALFNKFFVIAEAVKRTLSQSLRRNFRSSIAIRSRIAALPKSLSDDCNSRDALSITKCNRSQNTMKTRNSKVSIFLRSPFASARSLAILLVRKILQSTFKMY